MSILDVLGTSDLRARPMLELRNVSGGWGPTTIIENVSIEVAPGEVVSLVGRNGVGKTTTLETIIGRARQRGGDIMLAGTSISRLGVYQRARLGLGLVPQAREVFPSLSVREHIQIAARPGSWNAERILELFPSLASRMDSLGRQLSGGEQQMLAIARVLAGNPKMILMDEPSEGLAPVVVEQLVAALRKVVAERALSILLVEQRIDIAAELSSRCYIMDRGQVVRSCDSALLRGDDDIVSKLVGF